jgi:hypothetical protein
LTPSSSTNVSRERAPRLDRSSLSKASATIFCASLELVTLLTLHTLTLTPQTNEYIAARREFSDYELKRGVFNAAAVSNEGMWEAARDMPVYD